MGNDNIAWHVIWVALDRVYGKSRAG